MDFEIEEVAQIAEGEMAKELRQIIYNESDEEVLSFWEDRLRLAIKDETNRTKLAKLNSVLELVVDKLLQYK